MSIDYLNSGKAEKSIEAIENAINQHMKLKKLWFFDLGNDIKQIKMNDNEILNTFLDEVSNTDYKDTLLGKYWYQKGKTFNFIGNDSNSRLCFLIANKLGYY